MNRIFEKITRLLGSTPVVVVFGAWLLFHNITRWEYINFISEITFWVAMMILRGQNTQADRQEKFIKQDLKKSDDIIKMLRKK